jgi:hypothetical protein
MITKLKERFNNWLYRKAMKIVVKELRKDKRPGSMYFAWQYNLAMVFYEQYTVMAEKNGWNKCKSKAVQTREAMEFNQAAKNFLEILIKQK